ncbi:MAG: family 43 glycosylhydrolase, partial [Candidatus Eremiobacterota bacterium]
MKCSLLIFICICFFIRINKSITLADDHIKSYCPEGRYLWDSWVLEDNIDGEKIYRLYHLDAVDNGNPESRHDIASVRQAISKDLVNWKDLGPTFLPGPAGSWDDGPIWTGNVYKKNDGTYLFFYTARNHRDGQFQRIGLARSENGVTWERSDKPLVVPDGTWYETMEISPVYRAWRDPFVIKDEKSGKYLMYITAKTKYGHDIYKGCIALAVADEIEGPYEVKQPVLAPGLYAQMEVPQIIEKEGKVYIFFSCQEKDYSPEWAEKTGGAETGLHCFIS